MNRLNPILSLLLLLALLPGAAAAQTAPQPIPLWSDISEAKFSPTAEGRWFVPQTYRTLSADAVALRALLAKAPPENAPAALELPLPGA